MSASGMREAVAGRTDELRHMATDSRVAAGGLILSRITGFVRVSATAAVLGPTYFGNLFQVSAVLPNAFYGMLIGALILALLVPPLVGRLQTEGVGSARRFANASLGLIIAILMAVAVLALALAPFVLGMLAPADMGRQLVALGLPLLLMLMPQVVLYIVAGVGAAVQQAHGRFALSSAASAAENIGVVAVMASCATLFGTGTEIDAVTMPQLVLLGVGTTASVALHAGLQWWGAHRLGVSLWPSFAWGDPDVRRMLRQSLSSIGYTSLYWAEFLLLLAVSATIPGGVAAFLIAHSVCQLPIQLTAKPLSSAQLPRLAECFHKHMPAEFWTIYDGGLRLALFVVLPASMVLAAIPETLAHAMAFGEMATPDGVALIGCCIGGMALGTAGEMVLIVATSASYARRDTRTPAYAMTLRLVVIVLAAAIAQFALLGTKRLWMAGAAMAAANLVAGAYLHWQLRRTLPAGNATLRRGLALDLGFSVAAALSAVGLATWLEGMPGTILEHMLVAAAALAASLVTYVLPQLARGSQELLILVPALHRVGQGPY
ncbi:conserved membrane protein of unknown function (plasmid) [Rhodovastum atsumiense]|nr:lipid II flippase MurJ [Rhodovastum atsumiense]CAH2605710.1 conserved membrane protein of unknown function [Rhodovastum atsumiense]